MNVLDLFSGIGGFSLGLESTGFFKTIAFVEKDKFCQKVLQKNFPNIPIEDDVRNVKGEKYKAEIITGGFPCQPFSVAGKRRGTDDDRFLWDETIRIISETKPKWFIGENVEGIINIQDGMVFRQIHDDLESENFETQSLIIPASGKGAWHQRKRVWIIGCNVSNTKYTRSQNQSRRRFGELEKKSKREKKARYQSSICFTSSSSNVSNSNTRFGIGENEKIQTRRNASTTICKNVQHTNNKRCEESNISKESKESDINNREYDSTTKNKTWWQTQSELCGVPNGVSATMDKDRANRIKSLGNSIVPQIAREIGLSIMEAEIG